MASARLWIIALTCTGASIGCLGSTVSSGVRSNPSALTSLKQQESTKGDVLDLLGPPAGFGAVRVRSVPGRRVVWYYEHMRMEVPSLWAALIQVGAPSPELQMLLIFFDEERYDGHLWFEDASELENVR